MVKFLKRILSAMRAFVKPSKRTKAARQSEDVQKNIYPLW